MHRAVPDPDKSKPGTLSLEPGGRGRILVLGKTGLEEHAAEEGARKSMSFSATQFTYCSSPSDFGQVASGASVLSSPQTS
jgi:hypothetical protein